MIDAKELRIGNKVFRNGIVVTCDFMSIPDCYKSPEEYGPIPLTPEWLGRFGAVTNKRDSSLIEYHFDRIKIVLEGLHDSPSDYIVYLKVDDVLWKAIFLGRYVHQLQNIIHALTGEELETI